MPAAGRYHSRVRLLVWTVTGVDDIGADVGSHVPGRYLWARVEEDSSRRATEYGGMQTGIQGTISLRNYITLSTLDKIQDEFGRIWNIEGKVWGDNETILDVYNDDELNDHDIEDDDSDSD